MLTSVTPLCTLIISQRIVHKLITDYVTLPTPNLAFKSVLLKIFSEFGILGHGPPISVHGPAINLFYCSKLQHFDLFGLTVPQAYKLVLTQSCKTKKM